MNFKRLAFGVGLATIVCALATLSPLDLAKAMAAEDGPLEVVHLLILASAALAYFLAYRATWGHWKTAAGVLSIGAAAACLREFEFKQFENVAWLQAIHDHKLHWLLLGLLMSPVLINVVRNYQSIPSATMLAFHRKSWPFLLSGTLIAAALAADHSGLSEEHLIEELLETLGYSFLLVAALRHRRVAVANGFGAFGDGGAAAITEPASHAA
jgi:hypothetical protein